MGVADFLNLDLPTVAQVHAARSSKPNPKAVTRLIDKTAAKKDDEKKLAAWRKQVWARDKGKDRYDGKKVAKTISLDARRGECHHVEPCGNYDTRYDVRNGLLLSLETHQQVEQNKLRIVGTRFFTVNGKKFIDCTYKVRFVRVP